MLTSPTGSGKTVIVGDVLNDMAVPSAVIAHRQELLAQLALALNRESVPHSIIAPKGVIKQIISAEMELHGDSYYNARSQIRVAGVDTLIRRDRAQDAWFDSVQLTVIDEGHHVTRLNKWGQAMAMFPNARGLFVTAHAIRGDGAGLGRDSDGLVDRLVIGPSCRDLINRGMLTDYRLACPPSDVHIENVHVGASGEFNQAEIRAAVHSSSRIVGDVVQTYLKFAGGKLGITFAVDIESAGELANAYTAAGIPAQVITGETPLGVRAAFMQQFRERRILQLVSVDVLGEGVDVPAVEVISMARPTNSFQLFAQQCGRALRLNIAPEIAAHWNSYTDAERRAWIAASVKPKAMILDHVQNSLRHGLPDVEREYSLNRREKSGRGARDGLPNRSCVECLQPYERTLPECPYCGTPWEPASRGCPEAVEGDLVELAPEVLDALRKEIARVDGTARIPEGVPASAVIRNHLNRQQSQQALRGRIALYGALMHHEGRSDREAQKKFYFQFGVDVMTAQTLGAKDADALGERVQAHLDKFHVIEAI
jgi:DNA repair protein RadD